MDHVDIFEYNNKRITKEIHYDMDNNGYTIAFYFVSIYFILSYKTLISDENVIFYLLFIQMIHKLNILFFLETEINVLLEIVK